MVELIVSIIIVSIMTLTVYGIYTYSHSQVLNAERRSKVQNELAFALEHMSKYAQQANGTLSRKAIQYYPDPLSPGPATGFRVYIDLNNPQTPSNVADDGWIDYVLSSNTLAATCTANGGTCPFTPATENLTDKIISGAGGGTIMPDTDNPADGFYFNIDALGNVIEIGLVGRFKPTVSLTTATKLLNPQAKMKAKIVCNNASTN